MLTATEFHMREPLPLHRVQQAILEFCRGRRDVVVFGAQAVNLYVPLPRMSQDVDLMAAVPAEVAREITEVLRERFQAAFRVRELSAGRAYRVYELRREGNRHLADVRAAGFPLDDAVERDGVRYVPLAVLVALKAAAFARRRLAPKGATDLADLRRLLHAHPELRAEEGEVADAIRRTGGGVDAMRAWAELLSEPVVTDEDADEGY